MRYRASCKKNRILQVQPAVSGIGCDSRLVTGDKAVTDLVDALLTRDLNAIDHAD